MRVTIGTIAALVSAIAAIAFVAGRLSAPSPAAPAVSACPELDALDPALARLDTAELERRFRASWQLPPSTVDKQLDNVRASANAYAPQKRECMLKVTLVHAVVNQEHARRSTPSLYGLGHPSEELREQYLTLPLIDGLSRDERLDVVSQLEDNVLAPLAKAAPADAEHWRRYHYGLLLVCNASDEALARLGAARPTDCVRVKPRPPRHDPPADPLGTRR
jgi:hypothetical protein